MKLFKKMRDGGPESPVVGYFLVEIKSLFSVVLLHFEGTREAYHSHAFSAVTFWLKGKVKEHVLNRGWQYWYPGRFKYTPRNTFHKVEPLEDAWAISFRGPWARTWQEYLPAEGKTVTLGHGRKVIGYADPWQITPTSGPGCDDYENPNAGKKFVGAGCDDGYWVDKDDFWK